MSSKGSKSSGGAKHAATAAAHAESSAPAVAVTSTKRKETPSKEVAAPAPTSEAGAARSAKQRRMLDRAALEGKTLGELLGEGQKRPDYEKLYGVRAALAPEAIAKWEIQVEFKETAHAKISVNLVGPPGEDGKRESVRVLSAPYLVRSAIVSGVGLRKTKTTKDDFRIWSMRMVPGFLTEEMVQADPDLADWVDECATGMELARKRIEELIWTNDNIAKTLKKTLRGQAVATAKEYGKTLTPQEADEKARALFFAKFQWWCTEVHQKEDGTQERVNTERITCRRRVWSRQQDAGPEAAEGEGPQEGEEEAAAAELDDAAGTLPGHLRAAGAAGGKKFGAKGGAGSSSKDGYDKDYVIKDKKRALEVYQKFTKAGWKYNRITWRDNTGAPIKVPGTENDIFFTPVRQNDFAQVLFMFHIYFTGDPNNDADSKRGCYLVMDLRNETLFAQGPGPDAKNSSVPVASAAAKSFDVKLLNYNPQASHIELSEEDVKEGEGAEGENGKPPKHDAMEGVAKTAGAGAEDGSGLLPGSEDALLMEM